MTYLLIGIDPSLGCTGFAALTWDGTAGDRGEKISRCGTLEPSNPDAGVVERALDIAGAVEGMVLGAIGDVFGPDPTKLIIAVEAPQDRMFGPKAARSNASLPGYGVAVGAVAAMVARELSAATIYYPTPMEWGGKFPTRGDKHKEGRVRLVEAWYKLKAGSLGPKSRAGNVADAILLARYARTKYEIEQKHGRKAS